MRYWGLGLQCMHLYVCVRETHSSVPINTQCFLHPTRTDFHFLRPPLACTHALFLYYAPSHFLCLRCPIIPLLCVLLCCSKSDKPSFGSGCVPGGSGRWASTARSSTLLSLGFPPPTACACLNYHSSCLVTPAHP